MRGFLRIITHGTLSSTRKVIAQHHFRGWWLFLQILLQYTMSWAKESAEAGLAGLTEREAARGALCEEAFQMMPSPNVRHVAMVSKSKFECRLILLNVENIEDTYS